MHHVFVVEAAHHVRDGVGLADVGEKLIAQPLALGSTRHQPGDINELNHSRDGLLRLGQRDQAFHARVGHFNDADIGLNGAKRIILRRDARLGQRVKECGFADVGQADDAAFEGHFFEP